ncbi:MAG: HAD family hydrolase [Candidatus Micrarchaeota archaeon]
MVQWVCFDWGDTLADMRGTYDEIEKDNLLLKTFEQFGIKPSQEEFLKAYNELSKEFSVSYRGNVQRWQKGFFFQKLCERLNFPITEDEAGRMSDYYNGQFVSKLKLLSGAKEVVEFIAKKKIRIALISNANGERIRQQLEFFGLHTYFSIVLISDELGFDKSSVEPFKKFLEHAKILYPVTVPSECIMVGDRKDEDSYAKKAGMKTVIIKRPHRKPLAEDIQPDFEVSDLTELKKLLETMI